MSFHHFRKMLFSYDSTTRKKMLAHFIGWMNKQEQIQPQQPRKQIPKMMRGQVWKNQHGNSIKGSCYCCTRELDAFDSWSVGHIVARACGGSDSVTNMRPVCISCNTSMGTENMYDFKAKYYSAPPYKPIKRTEEVVEIVPDL